MSFQLVCEKCGQNLWLQVKADNGGRLGVREFGFKGLTPVPKGWRSIGATETFRKSGRYFCASCRSPAPADFVEIFNETPVLQDEPLIFVDPAQVDLAAEVSAMKKTYGDGLARVLDSEKGRPAKDVSLSNLNWLHPAIVESLGRKFERPSKEVRLYEHQQRAIDTLANAAGSIILATSTSSGKSLCFQIPWLHDVAQNKRGQGPTALYLAPLNALIDDQFRSIVKFSLPKPKAASKILAEEQGLLATLDLGAAGTVRIAQYHGGVPIGDVRRQIRRAAPEFVFTNPEMLSQAILTFALDVEAPGVEKKGAGGNWEYLFRRLRYVVLDECHELKGVYGSHVANLLRRLRRVCALAGNPDWDRLRYVLCSATIREPGKFAERLTGVKPALVIDQKGDTSERHPKKLLFLRRRDPQQPVKEFARGVLGKVFCNRRLRTIAFQESIPAVEELHDRFEDTLRKDGLPATCFQVFTANFLPNERVQKLENLRSGAIPGVVSTSALALGIDIGSLSCSALITYPGSMAKAWQMLGRAGRRGPGLQLYLLGDGFLDRFWEEHPDEFLDQNKHLEELVIMPDNPHILAEHIVAAHFDHPLEPKRDEQFFGQTFRAVLRDILIHGDSLVSHTKDRHEYFELVDKDHVLQIALRGTGAFKVPVLLGEQKVLEEDQVRAIRRLYPGAIFVHDKNFFRVVALRYEKETRSRQRKGDDQQRRFYAKVERAAREKITIPLVQSDIEVLDESPRDKKSLGPILARWGRVRIKTSVNYYYQVPYDPAELESEVAISGEVDEATLSKSRGIRKLPVQCEPGKTPTSHVYETDGMWLVVPPEAFVGIEGDEARYSALFSVGKAITRAIPLLHFSGPDDLLFTAFLTHPATELDSALFIYERTRGGVGLAEKTYERLDELLNNALYEVIEGCKRCRKESKSQGCPGCIADYSGLHDRRLAIALLRGWIATPGRSGKRAGKGRTSTAAISPQAALESVGFEQVRELGAGGMGRVFSARQNGKQWALKMASDQRGWKDQHLQVACEGLRQQRIAQQWGKHEGILRVETVITVEPFVFLQLDYADGGSLQEKIGPVGYVPRGGRAGKSRAIQAIKDLFPVLDAIAHMHDCGWVHRDIKPGNIVFVGSTPKLCDFGIARQASDQQTVGAGTPGYAAPGQIATGCAPDYRDDVYSTGVLLTEMLTGRKPTAGKSSVALPQAVPENVRAILKKALSYEKDGRYANAREMCSELAALLGTSRKTASKRTRRK